MSYTYIIKSGWGALVAAVLAFVLSVGVYFLIEPVVSIASNTFLVTQSITAELAFNASTTDVALTPAIPGVTGGTSNGTAFALVTTNNPTGYAMDIQFSSSTAMNGTEQDRYINNYSPNNATSTTHPDYTFAIGGAGTPGEFAYSPRASTSGDLHYLFLDNGADRCGVVAGSDGVDTCWFNASTTGPGSTIAQRIISRSTQTADTGATTTVRFRVSVPSNPIPQLDVDTYTATVTLSLTAL